MRKGKPMSRFFLNEGDTLTQNTVTLTGENYHHLTRSLRAAVGEMCDVTDGHGTDYHCRITEITAEAATLEVLSSEPGRGEVGARITVYQCLAKGDKMEQIITRCVEMGVDKIVPVESRFCIVKNENEAKKRARWQKIALSAAKQSGRSIVPEIGAVISIKQAIAALSEHNCAFVCYENEHERSLAQIAAGGEYAFLVGPEGGLAPEEQQMWEAAGIPAVSLGTRILRTENAATFVVPILQYKTEELSNGR